MEEKNKKSKFIPLEERKLEHQKKLTELERKNKLLGSPELFLTEKGSDEYLDTLSMKLKLIGGRELTYEEYLSEGLVDYKSHFYKEYYYQIAKLYGMDKSEMDKYQKPQCVAFFTIQFIYARFPKRVVDRLMRDTKWTEIPGVREFKLFQRLSVIATEQLELFIDQCVNMMKQCTNLTEFKLKYSKKYKVYFPIDIFSDISINP